jgi:signal transduction histidine kinase
MQAKIAYASALLGRADRVAITQRYLAAAQATGRAGWDSQGCMERVSWTLDRIAALLDAEAAAEPVPAATAPPHPRAEAQEASELIFDAALPIVAEALARAGTPTPELTAAKAVHRAVLDWLAAVSAPRESRAERQNSERLRLARQLHDVLAPLLAVGLHQLELCETHAESAGAQAREKLAAARAAIQESQAVVRRQCALLRERPGLAESLRRYLADAGSSCPVRLELADGLDSLPARYTDELFLIIREALRNAFTHSGADEVVVTADISAAAVVATVRDDGRSFVVAAREGADGSQGLTSMRERAWLLGGFLTIDSRPGQGTVVRLRIPLPEPGCEVWP